MNVATVVRRSTLCAALLLVAGQADAMEFRIYHQPELKLDVIVAEGVIANGDDDRLRSISKMADRDDNGDLTLVLNSPGGSVSAAFALVKAMDDLEVYAVVPDNAICASACASIVYASAAHHMVLGSGVLGFHSCYKRANDRDEESTLCNELIAQNAMTRGLSYASVMLFVQDYGPNEMAWVGRDVACYLGLCRPPTRPQRHTANASDVLSGPRATQRSFTAPSFDCAKATSESELTICNNRELSRLDRELGRAYAAVVSTYKLEKDAIRTEQRRWIKQRDNDCRGDAKCLSIAIVERTTELKRQEATSDLPRPSFDCAKATTASEIAICRDAELARMDYELGQAYAARLGMPGVSKETLRREQRQWIVARDAICQGRASCLSVLIAERLAFLKK